MLLGSLAVASSFTQNLIRQSLQRPKSRRFRTDHFGTQNRANSVALKASAISAGDKVLVIGGTGGVGQLTVGKLQGRGGLEVRTTSRNKSKGEEVIADSSVKVFELDLLSEDTSALETAMEGVSGIVISVGTTAFPTARWKGGNTPKAIDEEAVTRIAAVAAKAQSMKKIVMVTSVGVDRTGEMPFLILNLFGVLDAKRNGEQAIAAAASSGGFDYVVIRPGRLVGGPFTNLDVAKLLQVEGGAENGVSIERGDSLLGDCKRDACAEAVVQSLINEDCKNIEYSIISTEEKALSESQWTEEFQNI